MLSQELRIAEVLFEDSKKRVCRANNLDQTSSVIVNKLKTNQPSSNDIARLKQEFADVKSIASPGIIKPLEITNHNIGFIQIWEDFPCITLKNFVKGNDLSVKVFLKIAIQLVDIVADIHKAKYTHNNLNSLCIFINPKSKKIKLFGLDQASKLAQEHIPDPQKTNFQGILSYMSPEQTGRTNRHVDNRTDIYSLGVIFYEMLTGKLPFTGKGELGVIYQHLAINAERIDKIKPEVPSIISEIVLKCLEKMASDRYESVYGLKCDLERCQSSLNENGAITPFKIATQDNLDTFRVSKKLYGRESEKHNLVSCLEQLEVGEPNLLFVAGPSGIGKTHLVNEIVQPVTEKKGIFISGKYDKLTRGVPYKGFIEAFQPFIRGIIQGEADDRMLWQSEIDKALKNNVQVIAEVIPELGELFPQMPPLEEMETTDAQLRFKTQFLNFVNIFTKHETPLVIFLDDLQWADQLSLDLIKFLLLDRRGKNVLIIGAYRDNEVEATHPFSVAKSEMETAGIPITNIKVQPLKAMDIKRLLEDSFGGDKKLLNQVAEIICKKTQGNPFFIQQFLTSLYGDELLYFDYDRGAWSWHIEKIIDQEVSEDVAEFVAEKIKELNTSTIQVLKMASCIGTDFDLNVLISSVSRSKEKRDIIEGFMGAIEKGFLVPIEDGYRYLEQVEDQALSNGTNIHARARFLHDKIKQAAYELQESTERKVNHFLIAEHFYDNVSPEKSDDYLFPIVSNFNKALDIAGGDIETSLKITAEHLAELNYQAAKKVMLNAPDSKEAIEYLDKGIQLLGKEGWKNHYRLTFNLHLSKAECLFKTQQFGNSSQVFEVVVDHSSSDQDKAQAYKLKLDLYVNQNEHSEAFDEGQKALKIYQVSLPKNPGKGLVILELLKVLWQLRGKNVNDLNDFPETDDDRAKKVISLLMNLTAPAYFLNENLFALVILKMMYFSQKYGSASASSYAYCTFGIILGSEFGKYKKGFEFAELGIKLNRKLKDDYTACKTYFIMGCLVNHWVNPYESCLEYLYEGYKWGLQFGDFVYAGYCANYIVTKNFLRGIEISEVLRDVEKFLPLHERIQDLGFYLGTKVFKYLCLNLMGETKNYGSFDYSNNQEEFSEQEFLSQVGSLQNKAVEYSYYAYKLQSLYLYGDLDQGLEILNKMEEGIKVLLGLAQSTNLYFYGALLLLEHSPKNEMKRIKRFYKKFENWANVSPKNYLAQRLLLDAELSRVKGEPEPKLVKKYNDAFDQASIDSQPHIQAIARELKGKYLLSQGYTDPSVFREAKGLYITWGASGKARHLSEKYDDIFVEFNENNQEVTDIFNSETESQLDTQALYEVSTTINGELNLKKLLDLSLRKLIEVAGAQRMFVVLKQEDELLIQAHLEIDQGKKSAPILESVPLEKFDRIPQGIVSNVFYSKKAFFYSASSEKNDIDPDRYIQNFKAQSIFCIPLVKQNEPVGVLYLEHEDLADAFTETRRETLSVLASTLATALENSYLFEINSAKTKELQKAYKKLEKSKESEHKANKELQKVVKDQERKITEGIERETKTLEKAQELTRQASLANLTKGISHEIRNPMSSIRTAADMLIEDIEGNDTVYAWDFDETWLGRVQLSDLEKITGDLNSAKELIDCLKAEKFIEDENKLTSKFKPENYDFEYELPDKFDDCFEEIDKYLKEVRIKYRYWDELHVIQRNTKRTMRIVESMLKYGKSGKGIMASAFSKYFPEEEECEKLWQELHKNGYLDKKGYVQPTFEKDNPDFSLKLSKKFKPYHDQIVNVIKSEPDAFKKKTDVHEIIEEVRALTKSELNNHHIRFEKDYQKDLPLIYCNYDHLMGAFMNLVNNVYDALKPMPEENRSVKFTTKKVQFENGKGEKVDGIEVSVSDTGCGIPKEVLQKIREPFFSTKSLTGGTNIGLGLALVFQTVEGHGGVVDVASEVNEGTTFSLKFPSC